MHARSARRLLGADPMIREGATLPELRDAAARCHACDLWRKGTQTVFGEGSAGAKLMLVGEQPGDAEDLEGRPFVGPAGRLLDKALVQAGIERGETYVTNVVKHFNWEPRGKRRIHSKPQAGHIAACRPWLDAEIASVRPRAIVCLGATAAQALLGKSFRVTRERGKPVPSPLAPFVLATIHPSALLRIDDADTRRAEVDRFVEDLTVAARWLATKD